MDAYGIPKDATYPLTWRKPAVMWRAEEWFLEFSLRSNVETHWSMSIPLVLQAGLQKSILTTQLRCQCIQPLQPLKLAQTADM